MTSVAGELQLESEPQYNNETLIPEAQLLEHPFDIINGLHQAASEGIVPQVADAISLAHLPNPGFTIKHEINPHTPVEANDGKAAIIAGICGVTKSCEDRCCPIGDLDKARVRVGLINELKLNDPDFFNNPDADKIIKDRVNEIMEQKQQLAIQEKPDSNNQSPQETTDKPSKEKAINAATGFFGRQLSPQEAEQRMKELSGTYSQGKKVSSTESVSKTSEQKVESPPVEPIQQSNNTSTEEVAQKPLENKSYATDPTPRVQISIPIDTPTQKPSIPDHIKNMFTTKAAQETVVEIKAEEPIIEAVAHIPAPEHTSPTEISSHSRQEIVAPVVPQERIERHRPKIEAPTQQHISLSPAAEIQQPAASSNFEKPNVTREQKPLESVPIVSQQEPKENTREINFIDLSVSNSPINAEIPKQPPTIVQLDSHIHIPQPDTHIIQDVSIMPAQTADQTLSQFRPDMPQSISFTEKILIQNQEIVTQQLESTFTLPTTEIPVVTNQEPAEQLTEQLISSIAEKIVVTGDNEVTVEDSTKPLEEVLANTEANEIKKPTVIEQKDTVNINPDDVITVFSYSETITPSSELPTESDVIVPPDIVIEPTTQPLQAITEIQMDDIPLTEQVLEVTSSDDQIEFIKPLESTENPIEEIIPATQENFAQLLSSVVTEVVPVTPDIQPKQSQNDQTSEDQFIVETEKSESHQVEIDVPVYRDLVVVIESSLQDLPQKIEKFIQEVGTQPMIVLAIPQLHEEHTEPTEQQDEDITSNEVPESFILHMLKQEELFSFVYLIQQITDVLTFLHSFNNDSDNTEPTEKKEMNVALEELKNDTFGKHDDTVVMTVWPIIQFMLYMQEMQIFIPQKSQLTTVA